MLRTEDDLDDLRRAAQAYSVLAAWSAAGVLAALGDGRARRPEELPGDARAIATTAPLLANLGLLVRDGEAWGLSRAARALLDQGAFSGLSAEGVLGDLSRLDTVLRHGGPARGPDGASRVTEGGVRPDDREASRQFLEMLFRRSAGAAEETARWLTPRLPTAARILDVGGGHGRYSQVLADLGFRMTLFDRAIPVELARERFGEKLSYRQGDFQLDDLGGPYDAALLSNIVHGLGPGENRVLLERLHAALVPGGIIAIKDMFLDDHGTQPKEAAWFGLTMLLYTREGKTYRVAEMAELLARAGFSAPEHIYGPDQQFSLLLARRL